MPVFCNNIVLNVWTVIEEKSKPSNLRTSVEPNRTQNEKYENRTETETKLYKEVEQNWILTFDRTRAETNTAVTVLCHL